jgi:hypothetical protein
VDKNLLLKNKIDFQKTSPPPALLCRGVGGQKEKFFL